MSKYIVENNRFKKDGKRISKADVEKELKKYQVKTLLEKGKFTTRGVKEKKIKQPLFDSNIESNKTTESVKFSKSDIDNIYLKKTDYTKINKVKHQYRITQSFYTKSGWLYDLMRKDSRYGFERFCCHVPDETEDSLLKGIKYDLQKQKEEANKVYNTTF